MDVGPVQLNAEALAETAGRLVAESGGLLAMDESVPTCNRRFEAVGIPQTAAYRRDWRDLLVTAPGLGEFISGAILCDETIRQTTKSGMPFGQALVAAEIMPGIKVDASVEDLAGHYPEKVTAGLDGLRSRLQEYAGMGARFAKWRAVFTIGDGLPSRGCIEANAQVLARYAALCQEAGLVPVVEPEILAEGEHTMRRCAEVSEEVLQNVFGALRGQNVLLEGMLLKPSMVVAGTGCMHQHTVAEVADATVECLLRVVPAAVPGVVFLSGGQPAELASARLNAMNKQFKWPRARLPWALSFSFARAVQQLALEIWHGDADNVVAAQQALLHRAWCNRAARQGRYDVEMEEP